MKLNHPFMCLTLIVLGVSLALAGNAESADSGSIQVTCSQMENERERLECFDRLFPKTTTDGVYSGPATIEPKVENVPVRPIATEPVAVVPAPAAPSAPSTAEAPEAEQPETFTKGPMFSWKDKVEIDSTIVGILDNQQTKMVFRLENEQIWIQSSPRSLPFSEGDAVTIRSTRFGGHVLRAANGTSTRVQRIQ